MLGDLATGAQLDHCVKPRDLLWWRATAAPDIANDGPTGADHRPQCRSSITARSALNRTGCARHRLHLTGP